MIRRLLAAAGVFVLARLGNILPTAANDVSAEGNIVGGDEALEKRRPLLAMYNGEKKEVLREETFDLIKKYTKEKDFEKVIELCSEKLESSKISKEDRSQYFYERGRANFKLGIEHSRSISGFFTGNQHYEKALDDFNKVTNLALENGVTHYREIIEHNQKKQGEKNHALTVIIGAAIASFIIIKFCKGGNKEQESDNKDAKYTTDVNKVMKTIVNSVVDQNIGSLVKLDPNNLTQSQKTIQSISQKNMKNLDSNLLKAMNEKSEEGVRKCVNKAIGNVKNSGSLVNDISGIIFTISSTLSSSRDEILGNLDSNNDYENSQKLSDYFVEKSKEMAVDRIVKLVKSINSKKGITVNEAMKPFSNSSQREPS